MLDQQDFAGINEYVQKHGLQDASLAADRRAKKLNVNKVGGKKENGAVVEEDDDFDPGSEGESEGSGSDSEDEDGEGGGYEEGDTAEVEYDEAGGDDDVDEMEH